MRYRRYSDRCWIILYRRNSWKYSLMTAIQRRGSSPPHQSSSRKTLELLTGGIKAFTRGVIKQNFPTFQQKSILAAPVQWHPLCSGERRWSLELTTPNNMLLGFGRMAVGHFRSACEITLRRGREWGEKEEESGWERRISAAARRVASTALPRDLHYRRESAVLNTQQCRYKPVRAVSISGNPGDFCWGQLVTRRQLCSNVWDLVSDSRCVIFSKHGSFRHFVHLKF